MSRFVFNPETGCTGCPNRETCTEACEPMKKYLAHSCRAKNSPKAQSWGKIADMEQDIIKRNDKIIRTW